MTRSIPLVSIACAALAAGLLIPSPAHAVPKIEGKKGGGFGSDDQTVCGAKCRFFGLNYFTFAFSSGDNGLGIFFPKIFATFSDENGDDFFSWESRYVQLPEGAVLLESTESCNGDCFVDINGPQGEELFVLVGFEFTKHEDDAHVEIVSIRPEAALDRVVVEISDDSGYGYDVKIQYAYVPQNLAAGGQGYSAFGVRNEWRPPPAAIFRGDVRGQSLRSVQRQQL